MNGKATIYLGLVNRESPKEKTRLYRSGPIEEMPILPVGYHYYFGDMSLGSVAEQSGVDILDGSITVKGTLTYIDNYSDTIRVLIENGWLQMPIEEPIP